MTERVAHGGLGRYRKGAPPFFGHSKWPPPRRLSVNEGQPQVDGFRSSVLRCSEDWRPPSSGYHRSLSGAPPPQLPDHSCDPLVQRLPAVTPHRRPPSFPAADSRRPHRREPVSGHPASAPTKGSSGRGARSKRWRRHYRRAKGPTRRFLRGVADLRHRSDHRCRNIMICRTRATANAVARSSPSVAGTAGTAAVKSTPPRRVILFPQRRRVPFPLGRRALVA